MRGEESVRGKRKVVISFIVILMIIIGFISFKIYSNKQIGFDIEIKNSTSESIKGLGITCKGISKDIVLPEIQAGKIYELNINPSEDFSENSLILYYQDNRGYTQKHILIGYFEKGYRGKVKVDITSKDENGLLMMKIQEKMKY
ncbi:hypothetical protein [Niallia sp. Krafla_26]|uniref:hypothetical protein n=1 Tax=Niallia sp. Krafla_26 TaxID=3064703 RepID=UPI003D1666C9